MRMRSTNKGLTVKINLWALENYEGFNSRMARHWIGGQVTHAGTGKSEMFNSAGELLTILGEWNAVQFRAVKRAKKQAEK